jgi:D-arginine dehydrogenase
MAEPSTSADFIVVGAGIAGASVAAFLAERGSVVILEREAQPGYHTTGRSAALFAESYGTAQVRALTRASRAFLERPPSGFADAPILSSRGALLVGRAEQQPSLDVLWHALMATSTEARRLDGDAACALVPVLRREQVAAAILDPSAADIDVHALHHGFLRAARRRGGRLVCGAEVRSLVRRDGCWRVDAAGTPWRAPIVVNAAGAWCDTVAALAGARPIGLVPKRRSAFVFAPPDGIDIARWPAVVDIDEQWYFKPDAGRLLGSPANADPVPPHDVQPETIDVATGIARIEAMTTMSIVRPLRTWAGLRSFVADGDLVGGFDGAVEGFFWLAAQGGYGIQTSAAMGAACAALAAGEPISAAIAAFGLDAGMLSPARLTR